LVALPAGVADAVAGDGLLVIFGGGAVAFSVAGAAALAVDALGAVLATEASLALALVVHEQTVVGAGGIELASSARERSIAEALVVEADTVARAVAGAVLVNAADSLEAFIALAGDGERISASAGAAEGTAAMESAFTRAVNAGEARNTLAAATDGATEAEHTSAAAVTRAVVGAGVAGVIGAVGRVELVLERGGVDSELAAVVAAEAGVALALVAAALVDGAIDLLADTATEAVVGAGILAAVETPVADVADAALLGLRALTALAVAVVGADRGGAVGSTESELAAADTILAVSVASAVLGAGHEGLAELAVVVGVADARADGVRHVVLAVLAAVGADGLGVEDERSEDVVAVLVGAASGEEDFRAEEDTRVLLAGGGDQSLSQALRGADPSHSADIENVEIVEVGHSGSLLVDTTEEGDAAVGEESGGVVRAGRRGELGALGDDNVPLPGIIEAVGRDGEDVEIVEGNLAVGSTEEEDLIADANSRVASTSRGRNTLNLGTGPLEGTSGAGVDVVEGVEEGVVIVSTEQNEGGAEGSEGGIGTRQRDITLNLGDLPVPTSALGVEIENGHDVGDAGALGLLTGTTELVDTVRDGVVSIGGAYSLDELGVAVENNGGLFPHALSDIELLERGGAGGAVRASAASTPNHQPLLVLDVEGEMVLAGVGGTDVLSGALREFPAISRDRGIELVRGRRSSGVSRSGRIDSHRGREGRRGRRGGRRSGGEARQGGLDGLFALVICSVVVIVVVCLLIVRGRRRYLQLCTVVLLISWFSILRFLLGGENGDGERWRETECQEGHNKKPVCTCCSHR